MVRKGDLSRVRWWSEDSSLVLWPSTSPPSPPSFPTHLYIKFIRNLFTDKQPTALPDVLGDIVELYPEINTKHKKLIGYLSKSVKIQHLENYRTSTVSFYFNLFMSNVGAYLITGKLLITWNVLHWWGDKLKGLPARLDFISDCSV